MRLLAWRRHTLTEPLLQNASPTRASGKDLVVIFLLFSGFGSFFALRSRHSAEGSNPLNMAQAWVPIGRTRTTVPNPGIAIRGDLVGSASTIGTSNDIGWDHVGRDGRKSLRVSASAPEATTVITEDVGEKWHEWSRMGTQTAEWEIMQKGELDDPDLRWILEDAGAEDESEDESEAESFPAPKDYYQLLNVRRDATVEDIKHAYRTITKSCHPDVAGDGANDICSLVTLAYRTLSSRNLRQAYDAELKNYATAVGVSGYTGRPLSKWAGAADEQRAIFVDENHCIGCRECAHIASGTFKVDDHWGRARVHTQWGDDEEDIETAKLACPVNCIHYVKRDQLPVLEFCMARAERGGAASVLAGRSTGQDPFDLANSFVRNSPIRKINQAPADADVDWAWGDKASDEQIAFSTSMRKAWGKLSGRTKLAWKFAYAHEDRTEPKKMVY